FFGNHRQPVSVGVLGETYVGARRSHTPAQGGQIVRSRLGRTRKAARRGKRSPVTRSLSPLVFGASCGELVHTDDPAPELFQEQPVDDRSGPSARVYDDREPLPTNGFCVDRLYDPISVEEGALTLVTAPADGTRML